METIILLHGALGSSKDLEPLSNELKRQDCRVFTFSFSGHGENAFQSDFDIEQFGGELQAFILANKLVKPSVFGYSMGGYVALNLALKHAGLLNKIITLGTKFNWNNETVAKETKMLNAETIMQKVPAFAKTLEEKHGTKWKELLTATAEMMRKIGLKNALNTETLARINTPVLVGIADKDQMVSFEETVTTFKSLAKASMYMLPNTKHPIETVNVNFLARLIIDFIAKAADQK